MNSVALYIICALTIMERPPVPYLSINFHMAAFKTQLVCTGGRGGGGPDALFVGKETAAILLHHKHACAVQM